MLPSPTPPSIYLLLHFIRANAMIVEESISANACFTEEEHSGLTTQVIYLWITEKNDSGTFPISFRCVALDESVDKRGVGIVERETCISFNKTINNFEKLLIVHYALNKLFKFVDLIFHETRIILTRVSISRLKNIFLCSFIRRANQERVRRLYAAPCSAISSRARYNRRACAHRIIYESDPIQVLIPARPVGYQGEIARRWDEIRPDACPDTNRWRLDRVS